MDDKSLCRLFLLVGVIAITINILSIAIGNGLRVDEFRKFSLDMMCSDVNGTHMLSSMPDKTSCERIMMLEMDSEGMRAMCLECFPDELSDDYLSCVGLADVYEAWYAECSNTGGYGVNESFYEMSGGTRVKDYCDALFSS